MIAQYTVQASMMLKHIGFIMIARNSTNKYLLCKNCYKEIKLKEKFIREVINGKTICYHNYVCTLDGPIPESLYMTGYEYGRKIDYILKTKNMTIAEYAKRIGKSKTYVWLKLQIARKLHPDLAKKKNLSEYICYKLTRFPMEEQLRIYNEKH